MSKVNNWQKFNKTPLSNINNFFKKLRMKAIKEVD